MSIVNFFTQGGQTQIHQLRMIRQVTVATVTASLFIGLMFGGWKVYSLNTRGDLYNIYSYFFAHLQLEMPFVQKHLVMQNYTTTDRNGNEHNKIVRSLDVMGDRGILWSVRKFEYSVKEGLRLGIINALVSLLLMSVLWIWRGRKNKERKLLSGVQIVRPKVLNALVKKSGKRSNICLGKVRFPAGAETKHMLICGTTGSGKTNCIHELLPQIRAAGQRAVIVDLTGDFVAKYYREGQDILLNPFDARTRGWSPWAECPQNYHYDDLAAALIPPSTHDTFWYTASRTLFAEGMKKMPRDAGIKALLHMLLNAPLKKVSDFLEGTPAATLMNPENEKTATSIRSNLASAIRSLPYVDDCVTGNSVTGDRSNVFSIREWMKQDKGPHAYGFVTGDSEWLFLSATPEQRETLKPLISTWASIAISSLMNLSPSYDRRVWFVMDELHALSNLPSLPQALAEGRKYGGCFVLGTQDFNQLDEIYGSNNARSMMGLLNTKILFRSPDDYTAKRLSGLLGEHETSEIIENLSYGAHHMRDGVSLNDQRRNRPAVSPSELMALADLTAFLKLPGSLPLSKVTFTYQRRLQITEGFIQNPAIMTPADRHRERAKKAQAEPETAEKELDKPAPESQAESQAETEEAIFPSPSNETAPSASPSVVAAG